MLPTTVRYQPQGFDGLERRIPDFEAVNLDVANFGEVKTPGGISDTRAESVEYLNMAAERPLVGFATDARTWILYTAGEGDEPTYTRHVPLHELLRKVNMVETTSIEDARHPELRELGLTFVRQFNREAVEKTVRSSK